MYFSITTSLLLSKKHLSTRELWRRQSDGQTLGSIHIPPSLAMCFLPAVIFLPGWLLHLVSWSAQTGGAVDSLPSKAGSLVFQVFIRLNERMKRISIQSFCLTTKENLIPKFRNFNSMCQYKNVSFCQITEKKAK
jgi:hypothetical protein